MHGPTIALLIGIAIVVIASVVALQQISAPVGGGAQTPPPQTTQTATTSQAPTSSGTSISYNTDLSKKGQGYFTQIDCVACHSVKSLGISGGSVGPDLSKVLLGNPGASGSVIGRWFSDNGLSDPKSNLGKAADLLKQFLVNPPQYTTTMKTQVQAYKQTYNNWETEIVPALVEMLKEAAAKSGG